MINYSRLSEQISMILYLLESSHRGELFVLINYYIIFYVEFI
jgi:hypothetical protein